MAATASEMWTEVKAAMLLNQPFFASLMLDIMTVKIGKFDNIFPPGMKPTMATDGITIYIDEDFLMQLNLAENLFVVCHEIGHAMWQHMPRAKMYQHAGFEGKPFQPMLWNVAGDYIINDMLVNSGVGSMPKMGLHDPEKYPYTRLVDDVYRDLMQEAQCKQCGGTGKAGDGDDGESQGAGDGSGESQGAGDGSGGDCPSCSGTGVEGGRKPIDHHINEVTEGQPSKGEWKRAVQSAKDAAKAMGKMPAHLERFVDELLDPKVPWEEKFRKAFTKKVGRDTTNWARPNRKRLITQGVVMPTKKAFGAGHVVFCIDTSGSMSDGELKQALGEVDKILTDCNPERVTLIGCDAQVDTVEELTPGDSLANNIPRLGGGGGTSFIPPFKYLEEHGIIPEALVYFTDTGGSFPDHAPPYPVIWCCSETWKTPPFGEVIPAEVFNS